ncbi:MAG: hypothetical protein ACUVTW_12905 [Thermogutta sp.]
MRLSHAGFALLLMGLLRSQAAAADAALAFRLPDEVHPVMASWFWGLPEFEPEGYRPYLDMMADHSAVNLLTVSIRAPEKEVTQQAVHDQIKQAAIYARSRGMKIAMDLCVRLARDAFRQAYPDELQEMLRLRETALRESGTVELGIASSDLGDHYTFNTTHYIPLRGRLVRVYSYVRGPAGIEPDTVRDITESACKVKVASDREVVVEIACGPETQGRHACVMASFTHFTPAVFAPHLIPFQREILEMYRDVPLAGACKDEWGFPPCYDGCPAKDDYWYSTFRAEAYAERTGGRDLIRDFLLMTFGERGRERERRRAINHFMRMSTLRNGAIEDAFYRDVKEFFGPAAVVATHPTWYPHPDLREFKKNGLDWWLATRDLAQTDEVTPYCVRTSLAKKWNSPVWVNMFYSNDVKNYLPEIWSHALGGGRINFHPVYPLQGEHPYLERDRMLLRGELMRGDCRIRLLNFITQAPLECPAAVIFGHACAMNWAGPAYDDVGLGVADELWRAGYPADLIPSTEIGGPALKIGQDGFVQYGPQRYRAIVLYHPEFEGEETAAFLRQAANGRTALFRVGEWTHDFDARPFDGAKVLPGSMRTLPDAASAVRAVIDLLRGEGTIPQTPATRTMDRTCAPPPDGRCRLIDGTTIVLSGAENVAGDPIQTAFEVSGRAVNVDAIGVVGVRLKTSGELDALAAGGLKRFEMADVKIDLPQRVDLAVWTDTAGKRHGVLQGWDGPVPSALLALTADWRRLNLPPAAP